jgi:hypothetical protein
LHIGINYNNNDARDHAEEAARSTLSAARTRRVNRRQGFGPQPQQQLDAKSPAHTPVHNLTLLNARCAHARRGPISIPQKRTSESRARRDPACLS